jgi:hypothetical protein
MAGDDPDAAGEGVAVVRGMAQQVYETKPFFLPNITN